jgi:predicted Zn-dependent peptidase
MLVKLKRLFSTPLIKWGIGEIPESLKYDREVETSTLSNGVRVANEYWEGRVATVGVMIEAGSRNESLFNSGVAHYLEHMHFKGTKKRSKDQLEIDVENMGGSLNAFTSRDSTLFYIEVLRENCSNALDIISDMVLSSEYHEKYINEEQFTILREAEEVAKDMRETLLEDIHYGAFRDHIIGQPILGTKNSITKINKQKLKKFIQTHYVGPRIVVLGAGDITHSQLLQMANEFFGRVPAKTDFPFDGEHQPVYTPCVVQTRDEKATTSSLCVFNPAPSWADPEYWAFLLLQRIMGDYSTSKKMKIDDPELQYNHLHKRLDQAQGISKHECLYIPYKDVGLFGHYISCQHESTGQIAKQLVENFQDYIEDLNEFEISRGKNKVYTELLGIELGSDIVQTIGSQLIYMGRIIPRSEIAKRISQMDIEYLKFVFKKWFSKNSYSIAVRGPANVIQGSLQRLNQ